MFRTRPAGDAESAFESLRFVNMVFDVSC